MGKVQDYINFFETFAENHVDILHLDENDNPPQPPQSTALPPVGTKPERFASMHTEEVLNKLRSIFQNSRYKPVMILEVFDSKSMSKDKTNDQLLLNDSGAVMILKEVDTNNHEKETDAYIWSFGR